MPIVIITVMVIGDGNDNGNVIDNGNGNCSSIGNYNSNGIGNVMVLVMAIWMVVPSVMIIEKVILMTMRCQQ